MPRERDKQLFQKARPRAESRFGMEFSVMTPSKNRNERLIKRESQVCPPQIHSFYLFFLFFPCRPSSVSQFGGLVPDMLRPASSAIGSPRRGVPFREPLPVHDDAMRAAGASSTRGPSHASGSIEWVRARAIARAIASSLYRRIAVSPYGKASSLVPCAKRQLRQSLPPPRKHKRYPTLTVMAGFFLYAFVKPCPSIHLLTFY